MNPDSLQGNPVLLIADSSLQPQFRILKKNKQGQGINVSATKHDHLRSIPGTQIVDRADQLAYKYACTKRLYE